jgi:IclR family pca regulon transcriptional regulator
VNRGYATTDGRYFELTPRVLRLGHAYLAASLPRLIQPTLDELSSDLRESCSASVLDGTEIVYIARAARHRLMGVGLHAGSRLPAYCTSMGRVLLAALPPNDSRAILMQSDRQPITERTLTDVGHLVGELARIRADGYSIVDQEVEIGSHRCRNSRGGPCNARHVSEAADRNPVAAARCSEPIGGNPSLASLDSPRLALIATAT